jgi:hypothetical protein
MNGNGRSGLRKPKSIGVDVSARLGRQRLCVYVSCENLARVPQAGCRRPTGFARLACTRTLALISSATSHPIALCNGPGSPRPVKVLDFRLLQNGRPAGWSARDPSPTIIIMLMHLLRAQRSLARTHFMSLFWWTDVKFVNHRWFTPRRMRVVVNASRQLALDASLAVRAGREYLQQDHGFQMEVGQRQQQHEARQEHDRCVACGECCCCCRCCCRCAEFFRPPNGQHISSSLSFCQPRLPATHKPFVAL